MKIEAVTLTHVRVPMVEPFRISSGEVREKDAIIVRVTSEGVTGIGESSPMSGAFYSTDTPESCWRDLSEVIVPAMLGREYSSLADWNTELDRCAVGNFSKAGFETALWDIEVQCDGEPLFRLLGGERTEVESGLAVGLYDDSRDMLRAIERYLAHGYKRVKIKIKPGHDVELVRLVRQQFGDISLFVDANAAYSLDDVDTFRQLDEFKLMMFEQPLATNALEDSAELQHRVTTPICLDESLESVAMLERAVALGSFRIANIKIQRVGGLLPAMRLYEACEQRGIPCWMGTMPELGIGCAQAAAMASLPNCRFPTDVEASLRWFQDDIIDPLLEVRGGMIALNGWKLDDRKLRQYTVAERSWRAQ